MTIKSTLLSIGVLTGIALTAARAADLRPAIVTDVIGTMRIQQPIPCGGMVDQTTNASFARLEFTPAEGGDAGGGAKSFTLTRAVVFFAGFSVTGSCMGIDQTQTYGQIGVQLVRGVSFVASPTATPGVYAATIPKDRILFSYATTINNTREAWYKVPREDATATLDLAAGTISMRVVFGTRADFRAGCVGDSCLINERHLGTITVDLSGRIVFPDADGDGVPDRSDNCRLTANPSQSPVSTPWIGAPPDLTVGSCLARAFGFARARDVCDGTRVTVTHNAPARFQPGANSILWRAEDGMHRVATATQTVTVVDAEAPAVSCTAANRPGSSFRVSASDSCAGKPVIRIGSYVLAEGEVIKINETGQPGVRLRNVVSADGIRHFQVGPRQAIVTATDESNNVGSIACSVPSAR